MAASTKQGEIELWVQTCLKTENISDIVVNNINLADTHDGYVGDIIFVDVKAKEENGSPKNYNLVLKCGKDNKLLRQMSPSQMMFLNEINFYETVIPKFTKFQKDRGIAAPFDCIPKYYGAFYSDHREVLAFENLLKSGYSLWDKKRAMTRKHISLVIAEYAKFHAISFAMNDQNPEQFETLIEPMKNLFKKFAKSGAQMVEKFCGAIHDVHDILQDELDYDILSKWKKFGENVKPKLIELVLNYEGVRVICHGDSWNNNFMFQVKDSDKNQPTRVSILDWQIAKLAPPAAELAHFLFGCISEEDIEDFSDILEEYYEKLSDNIIKLKSDPNIYSKKMFLEHWKQYSKMGIMLISLNMKICTADAGDVVDIGEAAESGDVTSAFQVHVKDKTLLKNRMKHVVKYVVENGLVEF